ncbi:MAG: alpha-galactosidase [Phycisphaerales bacterium]|nr:alpha-galactosidase [Phycisphaerales bacterium]
MIFNDYMNCIEADPTTEKEIPLINAASQVGCDYFVMDAGWYAEPAEKWWDKVGVWQPNQQRFPNGINEVFEMIRAKGMIPGLWLEIERVGAKSALKDKPDSWFFMQHCQRLQINSSYFLDFRNPEVIDYVNSVIDRLLTNYHLGYLKLDHNSSTFMGNDFAASSPGQGLLEHQRAYLQWIESVQSRYPDLVLENCASGGCRMDYAMLSRKQLQSSSDQTDYRKYPSIIVGTMAAVLPEQLAVWSYPLKSGDTKEASFNMVNSMLGRIHLSGQLADLSPECVAQVHQGITIYKTEIAPILHASIPFFPLGMSAIHDEYSPICLGITSEYADYYAVGDYKANLQ